MNTEIKRSFKIRLQFVLKTVPLKLSSGETADETILAMFPCLKPRTP